MLPVPFELEKHGFVPYLDPLKMIASERYRNA